MNKHNLKRFFQFQGLNPIIFFFSIRFFQFMELSNLIIQPFRDINSPLDRLGFFYDKISKSGVPHAPKNPANP